MTRADGTLTASWDAPAGAAKYHVTYTSDWGQSWALAADAHATTSITISVQNSDAYTVGVRAGNDGGWSDWTNSPLAPSYFPAERGIIIQDADGNPITALAVPEGGEAGYQVVLAAPPSETTKVCVYLSVRDKNDPDITFKGQAADVVSIDVIFTPGNWNTPQTVTLVAAEDDDFANGARDSGLDARKYYAGKADLAVTEIDNDLPAPTGLSVTPSDGNLSVSWNVVSGATGYDVRSSADGSSWTTEHSNVSATSASVANADNAIEYIGVRAINASAASAWTELSRSPSNEMLNTATGVTASGGLVMAAAQSEGASAQSAQAQSQLAAPTWGTITRSTHGRIQAALDLNWTAVTNATGYNIVCSDTGGWTWGTCGWLNGSTTTYTSVPSTQAKPVKVTHYQSGSNSYALTHYGHFMVAIRAVNSDPAHASPWVNSEIIRPIQPQLSNVSHTRTDGQIVLSWDPNLWTTGYEIYCGEHNPPATTYTLCATLTDQDDTAARHSVTLTSWTAGGTNYSIDNTSTYHIQIVSTNKWASLGWFAPLIYPYFLSVSGITATDATLTIAGHTGQWWYKADAGPHTTCQGPVSGSSKALTGLSAQTSYTYSAYSASGCASANLLATAASFFTTPFPYVSNLTSAKQNTASQISIGTRQAVAFTTGAHTEGYVLKSVTVPLKSVNAVSGTNGLQLKLYQMDGTEQYGSNSAPSDTVLATLSGTAPTASTWSDTTWTCSRRLQPLGQHGLLRCGDLRRYGRVQVGVRNVGDANRQAFQQRLGHRVRPQ